MAPKQPTKVLVIGCGIAGPVLALLLKRSGYQPIVFEKVNKLGDAGASLLISPNGSKVLRLLGTDEQLGKRSPQIALYRHCKIDGSVLAESNLPADFVHLYGGAVQGVRRSELNMLLRQMLVDANVDLREGWALERIEEHVNGVIAYFNNGRNCCGSFLVGCDGIKSACRSSLLRQKNVDEPSPTYTGLCQVC
jgi:salicylate hydroxylase